MVNILVVDDSNIIANALQTLISTRLRYNCIVAHSMKEASEAMLKYKGKFDVALLDLGLPDAPRGEVVDLITKFDIPTIILTGSNLEEDEAKFRDKNIVDYVIKDGSYSLEYALYVVKRIVSNKNIKVLIVDDSEMACIKISKLLERYQLNTYTAYSAKKGLDILEKNPDIKIIYIDYLMPDMNGLELTREIRKKFSKDDISIIAISGEANRKIISKFLKYGANDFIYKGFTEEEFFVRLNSNLEILELFEKSKDRANKDYLTNMYNRRYLLEIGKNLYDSSKKIKQDFSVAILDIDNFKIINDTHGHSIGDEVLKKVSSILKSSISSDNLVARFGGEEFVIVYKQKSKQEVLANLDEIRKLIGLIKIKLKEVTVSFTVSIGACFEFLDNFDDMIIHADKYLYLAKEAGKNQIRCKNES